MAEADNVTYIMSCEDRPLIVFSPLDQQVRVRMFESRVSLDDPELLSPIESPWLSGRDETRTVPARSNSGRRRMCHVVGRQALERAWSAASKIAYLIVSYKAGLKAGLKLKAGLIMAQTC